MKRETIRVLLVDDQRADYVITRDLIEELDDEPVQLDWEPDYARALERLAGDGHDVVLLDYMLGEKNGVELLRDARAAGIQTPVIMLTAVGEHRVDLAAMEAGAADYIVKDKLSAPLLGRAIRYTLEQHRMRRRVEESRDDMLAILDQLDVGTALTDSQGRLRFVSKSFEPILGRPREELLGLHWRKLYPIPEEDVAKLDALMQLPEEKRGRAPVHWQDAQGRRFWVEVGIHDDVHHPDRKIFASYDVTELQGLRRMLDARVRFQDMVGKSEVMRQVFQQIQDLAQFDSTVMIEGETGTGKELVARGIHDSSQRSGHPFIPVNCAGLTDSLLASQLFGHRKGAFTGASQDHKGFFEAAGGGTIFLDEIADIPMNVQTMLLRVLQEREILRIGDSSPRKIDVRVLVATNRDLGELVDEGRLRADLLYRIRVARITLPPLRERREDIPLLAEWFLQRFRTETRKPVEHIGQEALRLLMAHDWPGNVRELQNAVESAAIRCRGSAIGPDDLPPEVTNPAPRMVQAVRFEPDSAGGIAQALKESGGNRAKAARILGISRTTLYRRLAEIEGEH